MEGIVYLLHLEKKLSERAQHYIGWTTNLEERIERHRRGNGSAMMAAVKKAGIDFVVAAVWPEKTKAFERKLKRRKNAWQLCPICRAERQNQKGGIHGKGSPNFDLEK